MSALDTMMPPAQRAQVNGVEIAYYEAGPKSDVPIVLCHGFPELAFSWRHQIKALAEAGRWVIAADGRGYGLSGKPASVDDYDMVHLAGDQVGLLDHLGVEKAIFCGHDWGGIVTWQLPLMHPSRVAGLIGLNTPFLPRAPVDPIAIFRNRFGPDMYIVWFQTPDEPERVLGADPDRAMRFFMRKPRALQQSAEVPAGGSKFAFKDLLTRFDPQQAELILTEDELAVFAQAFATGGFFGPVSWYRNFTKNWERAEGLPQRVEGVPCLMITAEHDAVLTPAMAEPMRLLVDDLEIHNVEGSGHWTQQEKPNEVNRLILDWLAKRFPR
jgi:pimeloyl-ACP methyl ester carboxylesterase